MCGESWFCWIFCCDTAFRTCRDERAHDGDTWPVSCLAWINKAKLVLTLPLQCSYRNGTNVSSFFQTILQTGFWTLETTKRSARKTDCPLWAPAHLPDEQRWSFRVVCRHHRACIDPGTPPQSDTVAEWNIRIFIFSVVMKTLYIEQEPAGTICVKDFSCCWMQLCSLRSRPAWFWIWFPRVRSRAELLAWAAQKSDSSKNVETVGSKHQSHSL